MDTEQLYKDIKARTNGEIYRTGKNRKIDIYQTLYGCNGVAKNGR